MSVLSPDVEELKKARSEKREQDIRLLSFHQKVYTLLKSSRAPEILSKALGRIAIWKERDLCNDYFITAWTSILYSRNFDEFEKRILDPDSKESLALIQNSPLSFLMREFE